MEGHSATRGCLFRPNELNTALCLARNLKSPRLAAPSCCMLTLATVSQLGLHCKLVHLCADLRVLLWKATPIRAAPSAPRQRPHRSFFGASSRHACGGRTHLVVLCIDGVHTRHQSKPLTVDKARKGRRPWLRSHTARTHTHTTEVKEVVQTRCVSQTCCCVQNAVHLRPTEASSARVLLCGARWPLAEQAARRATAEVHLPRYSRLSRVPPGMRSIHLYNRQMYRCIERIPG